MNLKAKIPPWNLLANVQNIASEVS